MVISDVPGREEDRIGLPLVGAAGQLFDRMLASIRLTRRCYITSLLPRPQSIFQPARGWPSLTVAVSPYPFAAPEYVLILGGAPAKRDPGAGSILRSAANGPKLNSRWY